MKQMNGGYEDQSKGVYNSEKSGNNIQLSKLIKDSLRSTGFNSQ